MGAVRHFTIGLAAFILVLASLDMTAAQIESLTGSTTGHSPAQMSAQENIRICSNSWTIPVGQPCIFGAAGARLEELNKKYNPTPDPDPSKNVNPVSVMSLEEFKSFGLLFCHLPSTCPLATNPVCTCPPRAVDPVCTNPPPRNVDKNCDAEFAAWRNGQNSALTATPNAHLYFILISALASHVSILIGTDGGGVFVGGTLA